MNLQDKVEVVTGASGGIGSATARRLAEAGCNVLVGYNNRAAEAQKVAAELPGGGHRVASMPMEDTAALREVAGAAAVYAEDGDFAAAAERALADCERLSSAGLERARLFSWQETARRTVEVYRRVLA